MSDPVLAAWGEQIEREQRANVITFRAVEGGVLWYARERKRRETAQAIGGNGGGPVSQRRIDQVAATYARLSLCTLPIDRELDAEHGEALIPGWPDLDVFRLRSRDDLRDEAAARVANLALWYLSSSGYRGQGNGIGGEWVQQRLADELGVGSVRTLGRMMAYTERVLRRRMVARGLLGKAP